MNSMWLVYLYYKTYKHHLNGKNTYRQRMSIFLTIIIEISVYSKYTYAALGYAPVHDIAYISLHKNSEDSRKVREELFYSGWESINGKKKVMEN